MRSLVPHVVPPGQLLLEPQTTRELLPVQVAAQAVDVYEVFCPCTKSVPQHSCPEGQSSGPSHFISTPKLHVAVEATHSSGWLVWLQQ